MGRSTHSVRTRTCCSDCVLTVTCGACQRAGAPRRCAPLTPSVCWLAQKALREQIKSSFRGKDKMAHVVSLEVPIQQTLSTLHTDKAVRCVCWTHDGELLASAGDKGIVYVCDVHNGEIKMSLPHGAKVWSIDCSMDGLMLATGCKDKTVRLWGLVDGHLLGTLSGHSGEVNCVTFSGNNQWLASASDDGTAILWQISGQSAVLHKRLEGHSDWVRSLSWGHQDLVLASGAGDCKIVLWDLSTPDVQQGAVLTGHKSGVRAVSFRPDGQVLASASFDCSIFLWKIDGASGELLQGLQGHKAGVWTLAWMHGGDALLSGAFDNTIRVWTFNKTGQARAKGDPLAEHTKAVGALAVSPDDSLLASASDDETVLLWAMDLGSQESSLAKSTSG